MQTHFASELTDALGLVESCENESKETHKQSQMVDSKVPHKRALYGYLNSRTAWVAQAEVASYSHQCRATTGFCHRRGCVARRAEIAVDVRSVSYWLCTSRRFFVEESPLLQTRIRSLIVHVYEVLPSALLLEEHNKIEPY